jgi:Methyltransferase domain
MLPFAENSFDILWLSHVTHHFDDLSCGPRVGARLPTEWIDLDSRHIPWQRGRSRHDAILS